MADTLFQFEQDFADTLHCVPMAVRLKLDTCGIKLSLAQWNQLDRGERQQLMTRPCDTPETIATYRDALADLIAQHQIGPLKTLTVEAQPPWAQAQEVPLAVQQRAEALGYALPLDQWQGLTPLQRFTLIKLSRPSHENQNFLPALQEFGLGRG
ncbi:MAG: nitrate reductase associated protein [Leptolyngbya sp.]|nr:nitrate reductase associated protein [Leptolyngbya sp.]